MGPNGTYRSRGQVTTVPSPTRQEVTSSPYRVDTTVVQPGDVTGKDHRIRRLPVTDNHRLVGMISEADLARHLPEQAVAEFVEAICASS
jgi:CBS domain-containing protein